MEPGGSIWCLREAAARERIAPMRVGFFGQTGPYAPVALRELLRVPAAQAGYTIALVVEGRRRPLRRRPHEMLEPNPGPLPTGDTLHQLATAAGIPTLVTTDVNSAAAMAAMEAHPFDVLVCVGFDRLFKRPVLQLPRVGGLNCHPSRLPKLRGPAPIFWAVKNGERTLAVSIHELDPGEDHGPVVAQEDFVLPRRATTDDIYRLAGRLAGQMLRPLLPRVGSLSGTPQHHAAATRAPRPGPEDARFDPGEWSGEHLLDFVNVAPFCRAAWTRLGDEVFFVRRALSFEPGRRLPGQYLQQGSTLWLQCRDGVAVVEIQV